MLSSVLNIIFNLTFISIIIYLIVKNNQLTNYIKLQPELPYVKPLQVTKQVTNLGTKQVTKLDTKHHLDKTKFVYNYDLCMKCIKENEGKPSNEIINCAHCGSENYDTGCIPAITQKGKPTNCIPKNKFSEEQAFRACGRCFKRESTM